MLIRPLVRGGRAGVCFIEAVAPTADLPAVCAEHFAYRLGATSLSPKRRLACELFEMSARARTDSDRRAGIISRHRIAMEARQLRKHLVAFERSLWDLDWQGRRPVRGLVGELMAHWLALEGAFGTMVVDVQLQSPVIRIDISAQPEIRRHEFWDALVDSHVEDLVIDWGIDDRSSGAWFEIDRVIS
jgi:hypothetical protein